MARKKTMGTVENGLANATGCGYADMMQVGTIFNNATPFLLSLNWVQLANTYKSNGFTKTAVDLPVSDAFRNGGFEIDSNTLDAEEILKLKETMSDYGDIETLKECLRWGRLYGGGAVIVSTEQDSTTPFNPTTIKGKEVKLYAVDRWQLSPNGANIQLADNFLLTDNRNTGAITFDKSRVMLYTGQTQPYYLRNQLQGWGASIFEAIIPQLNQYLKANSVILELLDEAKIDIIKINGLADTLASAGGDTAIRKRLEIASNNKNYKSMLAMDANDDYQQKQLTFGGLDRLLEKIFLLICSCLRIPYSKVFGRGASGFSSGEDDLENYNSMIDADIRVPATKILKQIIDIRCCQLFGRKIPDLIIKWKPLRVLNEKEEQEIKTSKINSYMQLFQAGIMTKKQVAEKLTNEQIIMFSDDEISNLEEEITEEELTETKENGKEEKKENIFKKIQNSLKAINDRWITIHPNGEDEKGRPLLIKDGETPKEAIERTYGKKEEKEKDITKTKANKEHLDKAIKSVEKIMDKGQIDRFKKYLERFSDLSKVNLEELPSQIEKVGGVDKALETLDKQAKWEDKHNKAQKLKNKFYDYVEKNDFKDERIYELSRLIGGFEKNDFVEKVPSYEEFKKDNRYNFRTELALKYLADKKEDGFDNYFKDAESDKVKLGYEKFLNIIGLKDKGQTKENRKEEEKKESILKKIKNAFDDDVIWRTVRGNHIPIKKGKNVREAIREFFENKKREKAGIKTDYQQILDFVNENNKKNITQEDILNKVLANEDFKYSKTEVLRRIKKADEYNRNVVTTDVYHKNPKTGKYYPDRQEKHKEILREIFANADDAKPEKGQKPIFTVLGGRGGSGKSKFKGLVYNPEKTIVLDADEIKKRLPEYKGYNAFEVHEESSDILNKALKIARRMGLNVVLDGTMKTEKSIKSKLDDFIKKDYEIEMYYMHLPREISAQRAVDRFMGETGRYVPFDVLLSMKENENNFDKLKKYAKKWAFYDNNVATKETPPKLIEKNY